MASHESSSIPPRASAQGAGVTIYIVPDEGSLATMAEAIGA